MSLHGEYDPENLFAKILLGDVPSVKVFEDEEVLAFMDVFPQSEGHTLVIPKNVTARNLLEMPAERLGPCMQRVQKVAKAVAQGLEPDGVVITQFNGAPAGQTIFHLHFHIIPRYEGAEMRRHGQAPQADPSDLETVAKRIREAL